MNYPFRFAAANANAILVISDETANLILAALKASSYTQEQKARFALLAQNVLPGWLHTFSLSSTADATVEFGCYDGTTFIPIYPTALLAAGSNTHFVQFSQGFPIPFGGAVKPALKVVTGTSVVLCGHVEIIPNTSQNDLAPLTAASSGDTGSGSAPGELLLLGVL